MAQGCLRIGNGTRVRIGLDPWVGNRQNYKFTIKTIEKLHEEGHCFINQVENLDLSMIWQQKWKSTCISLEGRDAIHWESYI